jgi:putative PIN family toxin of toxin-antitoxin system
VAPFRIVVDTNVLIAALRSGGGSSLDVLMACHRRRLKPIIGAALYAEYRDVSSRKLPGLSIPFSSSERERFVDGFAALCEWQDVYFRWRPNLRDDRDNHVVELAIAGAARAIVTWNKRDFAGGELMLGSLRVVSPAELMAEMTP